VIRAKRTATGGSDIIQLIPREKLVHDFPTVLLEGHVHWLNLSTSIMDVRSVDKLWESSSENWNIDCTPGQYHMRKGRESLIDVRSKSWSTVSGLLKPLETPQNILVTVSPIDPDQPSSSLQLSVNLPRYGLSFFVDEDGDLQSRNIRGMVYDDDQSIGTMFGLVNQLVLRPKLRHNVNTDELVPRCVLIPEGEISFQVDGHHVRVEIDTHDLQRVTYQTYSVDTDLGCLTGNVSLTNKLYRVYLHALTSSGCSTDPLTGRSGTEEALGLLRSATCHSIMKFHTRDAELLRSIASLCPARSLHPRYDNMQIVRWLNLPARSQNHHLYLAAKEIKEHLETARYFHATWETDVLKKFPTHDDRLFTRSASRSRYLLPAESFEQLSGVDHDIDYVSRDVILSDSAEHRTCMAATAIFHWSVNETKITVTDIVGLADSWNDTLSSHTALSFTYDGAWLNPSLSTIWLKAYNLLRESKKDQDRFKLLFSLSTMAYRSQGFGDLVTTLLAFAVHPAFRAENPPAHSDYNLLDGYEPSQEAISCCVTDSARDFSDSPEKFIPAKWGEVPQSLGKRRRKAYRVRLEKDADKVADQVLAAWPSPPTVSLDSNSYYGMIFNNQIRELFQSCSRNIQFRDHLTRVQGILCDLQVDANSRAPPAALPTYKYHPDTGLNNRRFHTPPSVTLDQLIFTRPPPELQLRDQLPHFTTAKTTPSSPGSHELQRLIATVQGDPKDVFQHQYASDLESSARYFCSEISEAPTSQVVMEESSDEAVEGLVVYYTACRDCFAENLASIKKTLGPSSESDRVLEQSGQWPRITTEALFRCIASTSPIKLTGPWKTCLVRLALLLLELQRARRLRRLAVDGLHEEFYKELDNGGYDGWDPEAQPDWILIQVCFSV
jgi:hypothetical protein